MSPTGKKDLVFSLQFLRTPSISVREMWLWGSESKETTFDPDPGSGGDGKWGQTINQSEVLPLARFRLLRLHSLPNSTSNWGPILQHSTKLNTKFDSLYGKISSKFNLASMDEQVKVIKLKKEKRKINHQMSVFIQRAEKWKPAKTFFLGILDTLVFLWGKYAEVGACVWLVFIFTSTWQLCVLWGTCDMLVHVYNGSWNNSWQQYRCVCVYVHAHVYIYVLNFERQVYFISI